MEVETVLSLPLSTAAMSVGDEDMNEVWVEEIVLEEDGSPAVAEWTEEGHWASESCDSDDILLTLNSDPPSPQDQRCDSSPTYILPDFTLTAEEDGLLDESCELMEDLMSMKHNGIAWKQESSDGKESIAEKAQALLNHLDEYIKEEPFSDWLEEKTELPLLEELGSYVNYQKPSGFVLPNAAVPYQPRPSPVQVPNIGQIAPLLPETAVSLVTMAQMPQAAQMPQLSPRHVTPLSPDRVTVPEQLTSPVSPPPPLTPALIREFESVLHQTLTPPHTPPTYLDLANTQEENKCNNLEEVLDTLINNQFESFYEEKSNEKDPDWIPVTTQNSSEANDWSSSAAATPAATTEDSDSACQSSSESDPEWSPPPKTSHRAGSSRSRRAVSSTEERKLRKKEQNKNAATRYRLKKKAEQAEIVDEESVLVDKNTALKEKATELQREIKYLKSLMRDICKAKGLLS